MKFLICVRSNEDEINEKKLSSSEEIKKSRSEDFFLVQFLTSLFHASSHCQEERMIYRINFHTLHFRYVSALLSPVAFFFFFQKISSSLYVEFEHPAIPDRLPRGRYGPVFEFKQRRPATSAMSTHVAAEQQKRREEKGRGGWLCVSYLPLKIHCFLRRFPPGGVINGALGAPYGVASYTMEFIRT